MVLGATVAARRLTYRPPATLVAMSRCVADRLQRRTASWTTYTVRGSSLQAPRHLSPAIAEVLMRCMRVSVSSVRDRVADRLLSVFSYGLASHFCLRRLRP